MSTLLLVLAAFFGVLNTFRVSALQTNLARTAAARDAAETRRAALEQPRGTRGATAPAATPRTADERNAAKAEADLAQVLKEKADLQTKLKATEAELASVKNQPQETGAESAGVNPGAASTAELQAQLDDTRRQLENAERENALLSQKLGGAPTIAASEATATTSASSAVAAPQTKVKRREPSPAKARLRGTVMAVNQAYNFVVLNLGERQGLRSNEDMLVLREGVLIGKLRISSVEPATAIGDIVTNSLARGVQVQPGDVVIYEDTNR
ncbi:MAG TPA: hypothetical protein VFO30_03900 [Chthoniobacterales bacterium]|nr:hypothetical protein [Chthoniobacterales bacterium]